MIPQIVDWRITANCNQNCLYCYATDYADGGITSNVVNDEKIIEKILQIGCEAVCISGGEPLLDEDGERAFRIIKALKEKDLKVFLSTNGTNFLQLEEKYGISQYLSKLSLPLDGYDEESSNGNGHAQSFKYVKGILEHFNKTFHSGYRIPNIKVSTVVTRNNINDSEYWNKLCDFINSYPIIKLWKIYDFVAENRGKTNKVKLSYTSDEFDTFFAEIGKLETRYSIPIEKVRRKSRSQIYFIIRPDGSVIIPQDNYDETDEFIIGNLLINSTEEILTEWNANIKPEICALYSNGRIVPDGSRYYEAPVRRAILEEIAREENKNNLYSTEKIIKNVSQSLNKSEQEVRNALNSLTSGENPIIREIIPLINLSELGLQVYLISLVFNGNAGFSANEIAKVICNNSAVGWCAYYKVLKANAENEKDDNSKIVFRISIFASGNHECSNSLNEILDPIRSAFISKSIDYVPEKYVAYDRILSKERNELLDGRLIQYHTPKEKLNLSKQEKTTLIAMSSFSCTNGLNFENLLAKLQNDFSRDWRGKNLFTQLHNAIDSLRMKQIINMFQLVTDDKQRGYNTFLVIYDLHPIHGEREQELISNFEEYVKNLSGATHVNILNSGDWDVDVEIRVKTKGEFTQIVSKIDEKFSGEIRDKQYLELIKEYKFTFLIPIVVDAIRRGGGK